MQSRCSLAPQLDQDAILVINLSGRGNKDMGIMARELHLGTEEKSNGD